MARALTDRKTPPRADRRLRPGPGFVFLIASQQWVDVFDMRMEQIEIDDIALRLSHICRFGGDVRQPLSVAEHSVNVMTRFKDRARKERDFTADANAMLAALLHDAAEAYLGDIPLPLKRDPIMAPYREAEKRLQTLIYARFGIEMDDKIAKRVKAADAAVLDEEWLTDGGNMSHKLARIQFLRWYDHLQRERVLRR